MRVGADVQSTCRKCGDTWHVVIAIASGQIAKVECRDCGARHGYRPKGGAKTTRRSGPAPRARGKTAKPTHPIVEADLSRPRRSFDTSETYAVGDRIVHPSFGEGVVQAVVGATKVEILFAVGAKTMAHARPARRGT